MTLPIQLVIPAAGRGSRFQEVGELTPKPLILIDGIPMILWVVANFNLEPRDSVIIICQKSDAFAEVLKQYISHLPFMIQFFEIEGITSGPASTVDLVINRLNPNIPLIVANSDQYVSHNLSEFILSVRNSEYLGTILTMRASGDKWSYIRRDENGMIIDVIEKKQVSNEATVGIYAWSRPIVFQESFKYLKAENILVNNEYYVAPSYGYLISQELSIGIFSVGSHGDSVNGLGTPQDLEAFLLHAKFNQYRKEVGQYIKLLGA